VVIAPPKVAEPLLGGMTDRFFLGGMTCQTGRHVSVLGLMTAKTAEKVTVKAKK
jgi:hypothetical protein